MREILFRGKRYDNGNWVEGYLIHDEVCNTHIPYIGYLFGDDIDVAEIILGTVGQYTGLTDKNGKKIFEGDALNIDGTVFICYWDDGNLEFGLKNKKESIGMAYMAVYDAEIIGNIHDNPEVLGGNDNV
jgi:hypothetical protein